jgi:hypothetical protein
MKKAIKLKDIYAGQLVVTSDSPEAQVRTVESVEGFQVTLTWYEGTNQCIQGVDYSLLGLPTLRRLSTASATMVVLPAWKMSRT